MTVSYTKLRKININRIYETIMKLLPRKIIFIKYKGSYTIITQSILGSSKSY